MALEFSLKSRPGSLGQLHEGDQPTDKTGASTMKKRFWEALLSRPNVKATRHAKLGATESGWISAGSGVKGVPFTYTIGQGKGRVELWIDRGAGRTAENKEIFDGIHKHKAEIEKAFGGELSWQRLDDGQGSRIALRHGRWAATDARIGMAGNPRRDDRRMAAARESPHPPPGETQDGVGVGRCVKRKKAMRHNHNPIVNGRFVAWGRLVAFRSPSTKCLG